MRWLGEFRGSESTVVDGVGSPIPYKKDGHARLFDKHPHLSRGRYTR